MSIYIVRLILNLSFSYEPLSRGQVVYFIGFTHQFMMASAIVGLKLKGFSSPLRLCDSSGGLFRLDDSDVKKFWLAIRLLVSKIATYLNSAMSACPGDSLITHEKYVTNHSVHLGLLGLGQLSKQVYRSDRCC